MKWLLIYFIISVVCPNDSLYLKPPPTFYMQVFENYDDAYIALHNLSSDEKGLIIYGYPDSFWGKL